jgi:RTX calcium-binding nonapeptide repeat (4 copies)/Bacterial Ig domain
MRQRGFFVVGVGFLLVVLVAAMTPAAVAAEVTVTVTPASSPSASDNGYTRINDAIQAAVDGVTITLDGAFDWTEANAAASWALGSDGVGGTADDYGVSVPAGLNHVTLTAANLGDATIRGPGDLAAVNLEGVLVFRGGDNFLDNDNQGWTISNIRFEDFDLAVAFFPNAAGVDAFNGTHITNNYIRLATDLNATVAPADPNQNIGIHFSFGANQVIDGNTIEIPGNGISNVGSGTSSFASSVGMQSNTSGGAVYDGLLITNNVIRVLNAPSADPERIFGLWELGHAHQSNIMVSGNRFVNQGAGNDPNTNRQIGFRVTSHSSPTTTVTYRDNEVSGANIGFQWQGDGNDYAGNQPVVLEKNTITDNATGVLVQGNGLANLRFNRVAGNSVAGLNNAAGTVSAEKNWWGCNAGPSASPCDLVTGIAADFTPWMILRHVASPSTILTGQQATLTADFLRNSDGSSNAAADLEALQGVLVSFTNPQLGTVSNAQDSIQANGAATATFIAGSTAGSGSADATVDNATATASITIEAANVAPVAAVTNGQCSPMKASGMINLTLNDSDGDPLTLTLLSNSDPSLFSSGGVVLGGSGSDRKLTVTTAAKKSGSATLTFNLSDGQVTVPFAIVVRVGTAADETLDGTSGTDMIFGQAGADTLNGSLGNDLLCAGNGNDTLNGGDGNDILDGEQGDDTLDGCSDNDILRGSSNADTLTGGSGADLFSGASGKDAATDLDASQGDTQDGTIP